MTGTAPGPRLVRVVLPAHLRTLAHLGKEVEVAVDRPVTQHAVLDALEKTYPVLRGSIRDHATKKRRPFVRFFACERDISHDPPDDELPEPVAAGTEPFIVLGAIAGG